MKIKNINRDKLLKVIRHLQFSALKRQASPQHLIQKLESVAKQLSSYYGLLFLEATEDTQVYRQIAKLPVRQLETVIVNRKNQIMQNLYNPQLLKIAVPKTDQYVVLVVRRGHTGVRPLTYSDVYLATKRALASSRLLHRIMMRWQRH